MSDRSTIEYAAANLFDGGWRAADRDELIEEYALNPEDADDICRELEILESRKLLHIVED